jgi:hypothetical protein
MKEEIVQYSFIMGSKNQKLDHAEAEALMLRANLKPLEPYTSAHTRWKCECLVCGSIVSPRYATVQSKGAGCKTCRYRKIGNASRLDLGIVAEFVEKRGGKLLSTEYLNVNTPLDFEYSKGHVFSNAFAHVKNGQWCPTCNKGSKSEEIARTTFEQLFGKQFPKVRPKWLKNSRGYQMEIDGFCAELSMGFEYQGIQHFSKQIYGGNLEQRIEDDVLKAELCKSNGINLFILTHEMEYRDFPKEILKQLKSFRLPIPSNFEDIVVDIDRAYIRNDRISELRELLRPKGIKVLSRKYLGSNQDVDLECEICGNKWSTRGNAFFNSRRTAGCDKCNRSKQGEKNRLSIEVLSEFAKRFQGAVISTQYTKRNALYIWKCASGHEFEGNFNNMAYRNQFCPTCEGRQSRKKVS